MAARGGHKEGFAGVPRAAGMVARLACAEALKAGVAVAPLLARAHLTEAQIADPRARLVARDQVRFLDVAAAALGDEIFGFHLAGRIELREAGLLYYVMASSRTMLEAMQRSVRYWSINNEGIVQHCSAGRHLDLRLDYVGTSRHLDRHHTECWAALMVRAMRELTTKDLAPVHVRFVHQRSACPPELARFFGGRVEFGAPTDDIRFDRSAAALPIASADRYLNRMLVAYCEEALAHRRSVKGSLQTRVENAIVPLLPHGEASAARVAAKLGLSERTFTRRLAAESSSFSAVLDRLRHDLARRYLADADNSISRIAWLLGYGEVSAFSRAFKRWTGRSPRDARAER